MKRPFIDGIKNTVNIYFSLFAAKKQKCGQRTFFVVFDNDYPLAVCIDKTHAEREIKRQKDLLMIAKEKNSRHYIHYHEIPVAPL